MMFLGKAIDQYGERWILGISSLLLGLTMGATLFSHYYVFLIIMLMIVGRGMKLRNLGEVKRLSTGFQLKKEDWQWGADKQVFD